MEQLKSLGVCVSGNSWVTGSVVIKSKDLVMDSLSSAAVPPGQVTVPLRALMSSSWKMRIITVATSLSW